VGLSIEEKISTYISSHPECKGKSLDEVISIMQSCGAISDAEAKAAMKTSVFGNNSSGGNEDGITIKNKKQTKSEITLPSGRRIVAINGKKHYYAANGTELNEKYFIQKEGTVDIQKSGRYSVTDKKGQMSYFDTDGKQLKRSQYTKAEGHKLSLADEFSARAKTTTESLEKAKKSNGFFGTLWGGFKNLTGIGASSDKVKKAQENEQKLIAQLNGPNAAKAFKELTGVDYTEENKAKFIDGEIKLKSETALDGYVEGQEMAADIGGDVVSGIAAVGVYSVMIAAAPVTGGASIVLGLGAAAAAGGLVKSGVKYLDAKAGGREYDSFGHDMATGAFSGVLAPVTGGLGGAAGRSVALKSGMQVFKLGGKEIVKDSAKTGVKRGFLTMMKNPTGYKYAGSTLGKLKTYGVEAAVDGTVGGGVDSGFRTGLDGGSAEDIALSAGQGAIGGMLLGPLMSFGFKGAGKGGHWLLKKVKGAEPEIKTGTVHDSPDVEPKTEKNGTAAHSTGKQSDDLDSEIIAAADGEGFAEEAVPLRNKPDLDEVYPGSLIKKDSKLAETVEKLDILNDEAGLEKLIKQYTDDMDRCTLPKTAQEYEASCQAVHKKWKVLTDKIESLMASDNPEIAERASDCFGEHFVPAMLHFQEIFAIMDNTEMVRAAYKGISSAEPAKETAQNAAAKATKAPENAPIRTEHIDAFGLDKILEQTQLEKTGTELLTKKGGKKVLTKEGHKLVWQIAEQIHKKSSEVEPQIVTIMKEMGLTTDETISHRSKSVQSLYDKIQNDLIDNEEHTLFDAAAAVRDGVGVRTVDKIGDFASYPQVKKYLESGDIKTAQQKAIELESDYVFQALMKYIDAQASGTSKVKLTKMSNYMGEDGIPYFTERQLHSLKAYADSKGVKLPVLERVNSAYERMSGKSDSVYNPKATTKVRSSGYTALQMNFETKDGFVYEWQYRSSKLNSFAEGEHIPYDLRTNKDIVGVHKELKRLYEPMKKLLTDKKKMPDKKYDEYNHYLTAHYEYLRRTELGFEDGLNPPKLPKGFDERLRAENLELIHEIAEKIKKEPAKEKEYLKEYNERLVRNTDENTTTESYTAAAQKRADSQTIDRFEASKRIGENNQLQNGKYSSVVIKACKDETGAIRASYVAAAEKLQMMGVSDINIASLIKKVKNGDIDNIASLIKDYKAKNPNLKENDIAVMMEIAAGSDGIVNSAKLDNVARFSNDARVDMDVIRTVYKHIDESPSDNFIIKEQMLKLFDKYNSSGFRIDKNMHNTESLKSVIEQCFDKQNKIDSNSVKLAESLLDSNVDYSKIDTFLQLSKTSDSGTVPDSYTNYITDIISKHNDFKDKTINPAYVSQALNEFAKASRITQKDAQDKWVSFPSDTNIAILKEAAQHLTGKNGEREIVHLYRTAQLLNGAKNKLGNVNGNLLKTMVWFANHSYDTASVKELAGAAQTDKQIFNKIIRLDSRIPAAIRANVSEIKIKFEDGIIRRTIKTKDNRTFIEDFDSQSQFLLPAGRAELKIQQRKGGKYNRELDDNIRGKRTRLKRENNKPYESTTVVRDPKTGEVQGIEYMTQSDVEGVFNIQYRDTKQGGLTRTLSSGTVDEFGNKIVERNYDSLDGTTTNYRYKETPEGSYSSNYKITDKNGTVLLDEARTFTVLDNQHFESTCNGKKYQMEIDEDNMLTVTNESGKTVKFDLDEFSLNNMTNSEFMQLFKQIPGHEFFQMSAAGTKSIGSANVKGNAWYKSSQNIIELGNEEVKLSTLMHEFGHNKDWKLSENHKLRLNSELNAIYQKERQAFVKAFPSFQRDFVDYFVSPDKVGDRAHRGLSETIAESNMLLNSAGGVHDWRSEYLRRYFPQTIAYIAKNLNPEVYSK